ncbi:MAG: DUF1905 domain-containing protein [Chloroflexi bacterium]|nr:DUF1905 domain-containing protein [Chloroflexota bacterium]
MKHYVPLPDDVAAALEKAEHKHVEGTIDGHDFRRVLHLRDDGSTCLKFGLTWLKQAGLEIDQVVSVELAPDFDPDRIDMPPELLEVLQRDPDVMEEFSRLSISRQKTLAYGVARAKKPETRLRRSEKIADELREACDPEQG